MKQPAARQPIEQHTIDLNIAAKGYTDAVANGDYRHAKNMLACLIRIGTQAYELCHRLDPLRQKSGTDQK